MPAARPAGTAAAGPAGSPSQVRLPRVKATLAARASRGRRRLILLEHRAIHTTVPAGAPAGAPPPGEGNAWASRVNSAFLAPCVSSATLAGWASRVSSYGESCSYMVLVRRVDRALTHQSPTTRVTLLTQPFVRSDASFLCVWKEASEVQDDGFHRNRFTDYTEQLSAGGRSCPWSAAGRRRVR